MRIKSPDRQSLRYETPEPGQQMISPLRLIASTKATTMHRSGDTIFRDNSPIIARTQRSRRVISIRQSLLAFIVILSFAGCSRGKSTDGLIGDLNSKDDSDRIKAVRLLQDRRGDVAKVVPALIASLKDGDADVRRSAVIGLGYFGAEAKSAITALEELKKNDQDRRIRDAARVAISRIEGQDN